MEGGTALLGIKLHQHTSMVSANNLRHMLQTCSCAAQTQSDGCWSIKVRIILGVLSVNSFFAVSVASVANGRIYMCKIYFFLDDSVYSV